MPFDRPRRITSYPAHRAWRGPTPIAARNGEASGTTLESNEGVPSDSEQATLKSSKYDVERVLGRGGMGTVLQARHTRLGHRVAIKILAEGLRKHADLVTRFEREARAASALSSPHAVRVFDIDVTDDGAPFMVMELLSGRDLAQIVSTSGAQPVKTAVRWIIEACDAIAEAHRLGIVHRDIKPANILLCDATGSIKVLDFGIAKRVASTEAAITANVAPLGTPQYMSPEQVRCSRDVDPRTDIWSLGVTLYELLTGRPPYDSDIPQACIAAVVIDPIPDPRTFRPALSDDLVAVILRALEKDPDDRFQTVEQLVQALLPFADRSSMHELAAFSLSTTVRPRTSSSPRVVKRRRATLGWIGAAMIAVAALGSTTELVDRRPTSTAAQPSSSPPPRERERSSPSNESASVVAAIDPPRAPDVEPEPTMSVAVRHAPTPDARAYVRKSVVSVPRALPPMGRSTNAVPSVSSARGARARGELEGRSPSNESDRPVHGGMSSPGF